MSHLSITIGVDVFSARLERDLAPQSCARLADLLPYHGKLIHARWSGEACWSPLAAAWTPGSQLSPESATDRPAPGQILLYAGELSEPELLVPYGPARFACKAGPLAGNPVLTIEDRLERLAELGRDVLWRGAVDLRIEPPARRSKRGWAAAATQAGLCGLALCASLFATPPARAAEAPDCHVGAYRLSDGSLVDVAPSVADTLRWRRLDGTTGALHKRADGSWSSTWGWTDRTDGKTVAFSGCSDGRIDFAGAPGRRIDFDVKDVTFRSHDTALAGRLVMPKGVSKAPVVVLVHGAEHDSALTDYYLQRMLPAEGVGVFVYDKRGTGKSGGAYSQDFSLLADDAAAAMREARRLAGPRAGRIGYQAGSQGGWVAPIAANRAPVDFVIVCFGLAVSVIDEDQQEVELEMREKGHTPGEIAKALEVARAAETVFASGFTQGFAEFDLVRAKYRNEPWYKDLHGNYTWMLLPYSEAQLREIGPKYVWGTPFHYDPMPTLRADTTPQLWIVGGEDHEAPSAETSRRIESLMHDGRPFTLAYYPKAEHGMTLFETAPDGSRVSTQYAPGYFDMIRDFARDGRLHGAYGDARITREDAAP